MSEAFGGIGSLASSGVPVLENTKATCGRRLTVFSTRKLHRLRLGKPRRRDADRVHGDVLLVQRGDELLAEPA